MVSSIFITAAKRALSLSKAAFSNSKKMEIKPPAINYFFFFLPFPASTVFFSFLSLSLFIAEGRRGGEGCRACYSSSSPSSLSSPSLAVVAAPSFLTVPTLIYPREAESDHSSVSPDLTSVAEGSSPPFSSGRASKTGSTRVHSSTSNLLLQHLNDENREEKEERLEEEEQQEIGAHIEDIELEQEDKSR